MDNSRMMPSLSRRELIRQEPLIGKTDSCHGGGTPCHPLRIGRDVYTPPPTRLTTLPPHRTFVT